jgi:hypothetical protein
MSNILYVLFINNLLDQDMSVLLQGLATSARGVVSSASGYWMLGFHSTGGGTFDLIKSWLPPGRFCSSPFRLNELSSKGACSLKSSVLPSRSGTVPSPDQTTRRISSLTASSAESTR